MILELIFITYLDPHVAFQADLRLGHAPVGGLTTSVCDRHTISIWTQYEKGLYRMFHSKLCGEVCSNN